MLRWIVPFLTAVFAVGTAAATDAPVATKSPVNRAASKLPPGLPRAHYKYRTTIAPAAVPNGRRVYVEEEPELLFTPTDPSVPYIPPLAGSALLPGSSALPGYYGRAFDYDYQGPYYGGPYLSYWYRLPYACGVYGYC